MEYCLAVYSSMTLANRVKTYVKQPGEYVNIIHTPKILSKGGCSYSLRFKCHKLQAVKNISENLGIKIKGVYKETYKDNEKIYLPAE